MVQNSIGRIRTNEYEINDNGDYPKDIVSVDNSITQIEESLAELEASIKDSVNKNQEFAEVLYSDELKDAIKHTITVFLSLFQMSLGIAQSCEGFTIKDVFGRNSSLLNNHKETIRTINEQNAILEKSIKTLREHEAEISRLSIDESFLSFIPGSCTENTCALVKELKLRSCQSINTVQRDIEEKTKSLSDNKERLMRLTFKTNSIENVINVANQINNIIFENKEKIVLLPEYLFNKINNPEIGDFLSSINIIISDLQELDEHISLLEKKKASLESIKNLMNLFKILKQNSSLSNELSGYLEDAKSLSSERDAIVSSLMETTENINKLTSLNESIAGIIKQKKEIDGEYEYLIKERENLLKENSNLFNKMTLQDALSCFKNKEADLIKNKELVKTEIETCASMITNRTVLEKRKELFEEKLNFYELLYAVWNPKTGYPSMLIKEFLDEVAFVTNLSLDNIWGGLIRIKEFCIDESEFRIPIIRGNTILDDITECSTAEKSTLSLAISLAIIQVSTSYNIIRIDEADGKFDEIRRQSFLEMITEQLSLSGCEDSYLITHNQHFENIPCNVILLKGYDQLVSEASLENKRVVYRYPSV
jgi:hypothetical protein